MSDLHDKARAMLADMKGCDCDWCELVVALLAENERLKAGWRATRQLAEEADAARIDAHARAEAAEARLKALCEAEPVAVVDREAVGRVFWLAIIPDGTELIPRPSMEKNNG